MGNSLGYDKTSSASIRDYARKLLNKSLREFLPEDLVCKLSRGEGAANKGGLGLLIEEHLFGYKPNSKAAPDFPEAGGSS